jgi:hypothetical protein
MTMAPAQLRGVEQAEMKGIVAVFGSPIPGID